MDTPPKPFVSNATAKGYLSPIHADGRTPHGGARGAGGRCHPLLLVVANSCWVQVLLGVPNGRVGDGYKCSGWCAPGDGVRTFVRCMVMPGGVCLCGANICSFTSSRAPLGCVLPVLGHWGPVRVITAFLRGNICSLSVRLPCVWAISGGVRFCEASGVFRPFVLLHEVDVCTVQVSCDESHTISG